MAHFGLPAERPKGPCGNGTRQEVLMGVGLRAVANRAIPGHLEQVNIFQLRNKNGMLRRKANRNDFTKDKRIFFRGTWA